MDKTNPRNSKRTIGHDALRVILDHERACANDLMTRTYFNNATEGDKYKFLQEHSPDLYERAKQRWDEALGFTSWAISEFKRQYDTSSVVTGDQSEHWDITDETPSGLEVAWEYVGEEAMGSGPSEGVVVGNDDMPDISLADYEAAVAKM